MNYYNNEKLIELEIAITARNEAIRDLLAIVEVTYSGDQEVIDRAKKLVDPS